MLLDTERLVSVAFYLCSIQNITLFLYLTIYSLTSSYISVVKNDSSNVQNQADTSVQKIITSKRQLLTNSTPKLVRTSNLQQLLHQGTQKFVINQANSPNRIIISSSGNNQMSNQESKPVTSQQTIVQNTSQIVKPSQQLLMNQSTQKTIQQQEYVNPTNQQQQIIFHGQRFVLNPGQRIQVTQQPTQVVQQIVQQPIVQQISQVNNSKCLLYVQIIF